MVISEASIAQLNSVAQREFFRERRSNSVRFSICIPQYNRTSHLLVQLAMLQAQDCQDFEICIADDRSPENRSAEIIDFLERSTLQYAYLINAENLRYDGNLRASINLARGDFCVLFGNDDCFVSKTSLSIFAKHLADHSYPEIALSNFADYSDGAVTRRVLSTGILGQGIDVAVAHYRHLAFVSGVIIKREPAHRFASTEVDGSEMYQKYLACKILSAGGRLLAIDEVLVRKDIALPGEQVDSFRTRPKIHPCPIQARHLPLTQLAQVIWTGIRENCPENRASELSEKILAPLYSFTFPYWLIRYRNVQSWKYAVGLGLGMAPKYVAKALPLRGLNLLRIRFRYGAMMVGGLLVPQKLFDFARPWLYKLAKRSTSAAIAKH